MTENFEQMAREYKTALAAVPVINGSGDTYLEQIITLSEDQLDALNDNTCTRTPLGIKMNNYLRNLTYRTLSVATELLNGGCYIPAFRNVSRGNPNTALRRLINDQIDIFILLDRLSAIRSDLGELSMLENRKMAILAAF